MAGVTVFMLEWSEAHFIDSLINSSVGENYVIDLLKYDKKPPVKLRDGSGPRLRAQRSACAS